MSRPRRTAPVFRIADAPDAFADPEGPPELRALSFRPLPETSDEGGRAQRSTPPSDHPAPPIPEDPAALAFGAPPPGDWPDAPATRPQPERREPGLLDGRRTLALIVVVTVIAFIFGRDLGGRSAERPAAPILTATPPAHPSRHRATPHRASRPRRHRARRQPRHTHAARTTPAPRSRSTAVHAPQPAASPTALAVAASLATAPPTAIRAGASHEFGFEGRQ